MLIFEKFESLSARSGSSPLAFIDENGMFQIPPDIDMGQHPKLAQMLYRIDQLINDPQAQNNPIIAQLAIAAGLNINDPDDLEILRITFSNGMGPTLNFENSTTDFGRTFRDISNYQVRLERHLLDDVENNTWTPLRAFLGYRYFGFTRNGSLQQNAASMLTLFFTIFHEGGHASAMACGTQPPPVPPGTPDNFDVGFEQQLLGPGPQGDITSRGLLIRNQIVGTTNGNSRNRPPIGFLINFNIRNYVYPSPRERNSGRSNYKPKNMILIKSNKIEDTRPEPELKLSK